jgi:WD40 repeat protein
MNSYLREANSLLSASVEKESHERDVNSIIKQANSPALLRKKVNVEFAQDGDRKVQIMTKTSELNTPNGNGFKVIDDTENVLKREATVTNAERQVPVKSKSIIATPRVHLYSVEALEFNSQSHALVTCSEDGTVKYWNIKDLKEKKNEYEPLAVFRGHEGAVSCTCVSDDGQYCFTGGVF